MVGAVPGESSLQQAVPGRTRRAFGVARGTPIAHLALAVLSVVAPLLLIVALAWPMVFTNAILNGDWVNHLWYMWHQSLNIRVDHRPSFFLNYTPSVFYPIYAFYGGTTYALVGAFSLLLGNAPIETYVLSYLAGFAAAYGGWYWMARMAGLGRGWSHAPGVIFITSTYYLTLIYARGDWAEFLAISTIPLLIASGLSVLRADRLSLWPALALVGSIVFLASHSLTLLWGGTLIALLAVLVVICIPEARKWLTRARVARVAVVAVPAALVNAWFLLPAIAYQSHTEIASNYLGWRLLLKSSMYIVSAANLFTLSRAAALTPGESFVVALPVLAMVWILGGLALLLRRGAHRGWARMSLLCAGLTVLMLVVMTHASLILALPRPYATLQYSYRLESYVLLCVSGAVLAVLVLAQKSAGRTRLWMWLLLPILIATVIGAIYQTDNYSRGGDRRTTLRYNAQPYFGTSVGDYSDVHLPELVANGGNPPEVIFPAMAVRSDRVSEVVHLQPKELVYTNIGGGPELVHVAGARIVGLGPRGDVLEIGPSTGGRTGSTAGRGGSPWTEVITLSQASGLPVILGRILSLAAIAFLLGGFVVLGLRALEDRRRASAR
jgi:hypothetical protein